MAAVVGVALLLTGCASVPADGSWRPRVAEVPSAILDYESAAPSEVASNGVDVRLLYAAVEGSPVSARWAEIPGFAPLTDRVRGLVRDELAKQADRSGIGYRPRADAPELSPADRGCVAGSTTAPAEDLLRDPRFAAPGGGESLTVVCEILGARDTVLVQRVRVVTAAAGAVTGERVETLYADVRDGVVVSAGELLEQSQLPALLRDVVTVLRDRAGALVPAMQEDPAAVAPETLRTLFSDVYFDATGALVVTLPADFTTPELERLKALPEDGSRVAVALLAADADRFLSAAGRSIHAQLTSDVPFAAPPAPAPGEEGVDCSFFACVSLTFDDGPSSYTPGVLDELAKRRMAATFFLVGSAIGGDEDVVARMAREGHEVGNHTWSHPMLTKLKDPEIADELRRTSEAIRRITGEPVRMYRPPYGDVDDRVQKAAGLPAILWSVDTNDWRRPDDQTLLASAVGDAAPGGIILCHDINDSTARLVPRILDGLAGRGFTLVTVSQLLDGRFPGPSAMVRSG